MKRFLTIGLALGCLTFSTSAALAVPFLQLDISGGTYVGPPEETVFAQTGEFTLYALIDTSKKYWPAPAQGWTYRVAASLVPPIQPEPPTPPDLGSFTFNGTTINVAGDMTYGTPPLETMLDALDLPSHGVFETYYMEFDFTPNASQNVASYDSMDNPGGIDLASTGDLIYEAFSVNTNGLTTGYRIHFDLYAISGLPDSPELKQFAPFSHDAESMVPEPGTVVLLAAGGLIGLAGGLRSKKARRR